MKMSRAQNHRAILEFAGGAAALTLALSCFTYFIPSVMVSSRLLLSLWALLPLYLLTGGVLLFFGKRTSVWLLAAIGGRQIKLDLLSMLRRIMTAAFALILLAFAVQTVYRSKNLSSASAVAPNTAVPSTVAPNTAVPSTVAPNTAVPSTVAPKIPEPEILSSTNVIAHALGALDGHSYLNCLESFQAMYEQGVRVFEADFALTADGDVVLCHDWDSWRNTLQEGFSGYAVPTTEEFLSKPFLGVYTPLTFRDLLLLMDQYPDICIVTDFKYKATEIALTQFGIMMDEAEALNLSHLFDRIIVQVYNQAMLEALDRAFHFQYYIFTLYMAGFDGTDGMFRELAEYSAAHRVMGITMWDYLWNPSLQSIAGEYGLSVYVHTVNDLDRGRELLAAGVSAIYTDSLTDSILAGAA